jgi:hypothetical protein
LETKSGYKYLGLKEEVENAREVEKLRNGEVYSFCPNSFSLSFKDVQMKENV